MSSVARALTAMGLLSLIFGLFQAHIGDLSERRSQRALRGTLTEMLGSGSGFPRGSKSKVGPIPPGSAVALLDISKIGVHKVVVEGAGAESLKKGPGVTSSSTLPGQPGQSVIVGRRTTFGAPFRHLDSLAAGDVIRVTTPFGRFRYVTRESHFVRPGNATQLGPADESVLTLVTSDPPYLGDRALVIVAVLQGGASTFEEPPRATTADAGSFSFGGNPGSMVGALVTGVFFLGMLMTADSLYRRWRRWPTYLLTTPVLLALLFAWMQNLASLFPSSI